MGNPIKKTFILLFLLGVAGVGKGQDLVTLANRFLAMLDEKQKAKAQYVLDDPERFNWHFVPISRNGLCYKTLTPPQREAALAMLKASLSDEGYRKATNIMALENVLREIESRGAEDTYRDPLNYYFTIFGTPGDQPWGWRFEGHHVSINFFSNHKELVSGTPTFMGSNPGIVPRGPELGKEILKLETDLGYELCNAFTTEQKKIVIFSEKALPEIVSGDSRRTQLLEPVGLTYAKMNENQRALLIKLLGVFVKNYELGFSNRLMSKINKAGIENLSFAWAGSLTPGEGHYYRIQGPMLLIEYDNTQNNANHVHTAVRDLTNDFAEDILREHYQKEQH